MWRRSTEWDEVGIYGHAHGAVMGNTRFHDYIVSFRLMTTGWCARCKRVTAELGLEVSGPVVMISTLLLQMLTEMSLSLQQQSMSCLQLESSVLRPLWDDVGSFVKQQHRLTTSSWAKAVFG